MTVTIQQVLRPFFIICFIMGLCTYPMKQRNRRIRWIASLSILYCLTIWFTYAYLLYYIVTWKVLYPSIAFRIVLMMNIFTSIISAILGFYHQKRFEISMKMLNAVDNTLEELGIPKMYEKIHMRSKLVIIGWIINSFTINIVDTIWWRSLKKINSWELLLPFIINHSIHINALVNLVFIFPLWYITTRFDKLNERMQCLLVREDRRTEIERKNGLRCKWKKSVIILHQHTLYIDNYKRTLWISMHLHLELCRIARELNSMFGTQMTSEMATHLIFITSLCYCFCMLLMQEMHMEMLQSPYSWLTINFWIFTILIRLYSINYISESVMVKANKIDKILHQLTNILRYADVRKEIYQFTLQITHHPLKLTGMNLFYLGNEFLRKFCVTIVTFVIIMVQMKIYVGPYNL